MVPLFQSPFGTASTIKSNVQKSRWRAEIGVFPSRKLVGPDSDPHKESVSGSPDHTPCFTPAPWYCSPQLYPADFLNSEKLGNISLKLVPLPLCPLSTKDHLPNYLSYTCTRFTIPPPPPHPNLSILPQCVYGGCHCSHQLTAVTLLAFR